jgi:F-type H+-transporting ATPase subunit b
MEALGINFTLLISQAINFVVMVVILHMLLYKRVLGMLQKRTERIEQSIKDADQVKEQLANAKRDYEAEIGKARQEGAKILAQAQDRAKVQESEIVAEARQEAERIRAEAREQAQRERDQLIGEVKDQLAELVAETASRVLQAEVSAKTHNKLIEESLAELAKNN